MWIEHIHPAPRFLLDTWEWRGRGGGAGDGGWRWWGVQSLVGHLHLAQVIWVHPWLHADSSVDISTLPVQSWFSYMVSTDCIEAGFCPRPGQGNDQMLALIPFAGGCLWLCIWGRFQHAAFFLDRRDALPWIIYWKPLSNTKTRVEWAHWDERAIHQHILTCHPWVPFWMLSQAQFVLNEINHSFAREKEGFFWATFWIPNKKGWATWFIWINKWLNR